MAHRSHDRHDHGGTRRQFLGAMAAALSGIATTASAQAAGGYKALVFIYLGGGNDGLNTVVPADAGNHAEYRRLRGGIALPVANLLPLQPLNSLGGKQLGLHPRLGPLKDLFDAGRAAVVANVGPLVRPVTLADWRANRYLPADLGSHNGQHTLWQNAAVDGRLEGWGGLVADRLAATSRPSPFSCISTSGLYSELLNGGRVSQLTLATDGQSSAMGGVDTSWMVTHKTHGPPQATIGEEIRKGMVGSDKRKKLLQRDFAAVVENYFATRDALADAMAPASDFATPPSSRNDDRLGEQLRTVARVMAGRSRLGASRQIFSVELGGFDTHMAQLGSHEEKMIALANAIKYFDGLTTQLGLRDSVTLCTISEFGRTLGSNGDGTDHGWGSHHFVVGGAVKGARVYGKVPTIAYSNEDFTDWGQMIPAVAVDQYVATLATWFGLSDAQVLSALPNLSAFSNRNIGFMA